MNLEQLEYLYYTTTADMPSFILSINCGSSSVKGKLFEIAQDQKSLTPVASLAVSGVGAPGKRIQIKVEWIGDIKGKNVKEEGDEGDVVEYKTLVPLLLKKLVQSGGVEKENFKYITHRVVHGGTHREPLRITKEHMERLEEMDRLSQFAPLHNHHSVLAVRSCFDVLPDHESLLVFDTLFHQSLPEEVYTYAFPKAELEQTMPIRKYGFHGLSYGSILGSVAQKLIKKEQDVSIVVAHLGSGGSACCIKNGQSIDTSMGLTPLEGLVGGTRSGSVDPTAVFHLIPDASGPDPKLKEDGMEVSKAEILLNKQSGLKALAGTSDFGTILSRLEAPKDGAEYSDEDNNKAVLAYKVYLDRVLHFISAYVFKLLSTASPSAPGKTFDGIVFSGGIGEKSSKLRADVLNHFRFLGAVVDEKANGKPEGQVVEITTEESEIRGWVVETDEEGYAAHVGLRTWSKQ